MQFNLNKMIKIKLLSIITLLFYHTFQAQSVIKSDSEKKLYSIDSVFSNDIGGIKQVIRITTSDVKRPILFFLSGGPGSSMMNNSDKFTNVLKDHFTLIQWDQRDAGKTLALNPSQIQVSLDLMTKDTYEVIRFVLKELKQEKLYLLGSSWGNVLGFDIVQKHPELLYSYFAVNPVVNQLSSEKELLKTLKIYFKDNPDARTELEKVNIPFLKEEDLFYLRKWLFFKEGKTFVTENNFKNGFLQWSKRWSPVWNEVMTINLSKTLKEINCPIYFFVGKNDIQTLTKITTEYYKSLKAPHKNIFLFEDSGHQIHQDEPEKFQNTIIQSLNLDISKP